eukprot:CAMPEP_0167745390 /NCGR_PEP_ID=MMETSP0110_2-20121227/3124_1 /TAXON_ID=629695 /ORGANISM="Gymnochlora sp., Strain CCMP2014" /LENGTH=471 /DNA_ID=CAMNT_0007630025 /DNA_START=201 /DNA_END=1616 /DNA_ORIENTATION=-
MEKSFKPRRRLAVDYGPWNAKNFANISLNSEIASDLECPLYYYRNYNQEVPVAPLRQGSQEYQKWADEKSKAPFLIQDHWKDSIWMGGQEMAEWHRTCTYSKIDGYRFHNGDTIETLISPDGSAGSLGLILRIPFESSMSRYGDNAWHMLQDNPALWCAVWIAQKQGMRGPPPWDMKVIIENDIAESKLIWSKYFLASIFREVISWKDAALHDYSQILHWSYAAPTSRYHNWLINRGRSPIYAQETEALLINIPKSRFKLDRLRAVKNGFANLVPPIPARSRCSVVAISRSHSSIVRSVTRNLVAKNTGTFAGILQALCEAGIETRGAEINTKVPLAMQYRLIMQADALISVHGAQLANLVWMPEGSAVIEVTLRYGYCCRPVPEENMGFTSPPCKGPCSPYDYVVYAMQAQQFGIEYYYYDPLYVEQLTCSECDDCGNKDTKQTSHVVLDEKHFARSVSGILKRLGKCSL